MNRQLPLYDEFSNRELNQQYAREQRNDQIRNQVIGAPQPILIDPKEYVIKSQKINCNRFKTFEIGGL